MGDFRVVLADDHALLREMLSERLASRAGFEVVMARDADEAFGHALRLKPHVVVLDVDMPGRNVFEVAKSIRQALDRTAVMFLSGHFHDRYIEQAVSAGARGYVVKSGSAERVVDAITMVASGGVAFSPEVLERVIVDRDGVRMASAAGGASGPSVQTRLASLSDREREVLRYLATGLSKKEIAAQMHLSVKTVQNHADRLMQKLAIHDRVELARFAIREGIINP
ncbi:MAG: response regulator transcription factor [Phycisphaerales bacterium]|nr:response regulator transcription factor [Phycisphaerales bacterium]